MLQRRCCSLLQPTLQQECNGLVEPVALLLQPVALLLQPVAACLEYLEIVFARRIAQAHVHVRVTCAQTKGRGLGV